MPVRDAADGLTLRRLALVLVLAAAVMVMRVLSTPGPSHHSPLGVMSAMAPIPDGMGSADTGHGPAPTGHPSAPESGSPMARVAMLLSSLVLIRTVSSVLEPSLGSIPNRDQLFGLFAGFAAIALFLYAWIEARRWPVSNQTEGGGGIRPT